MFVGISLGIAGRNSVGGFSPLDPGGLVLWLRADAGVTVDGSNNVSTWTDQSGNGKDATQASASLRPAYQTNQQNGLPMIRCDGVDDIMEGTNPLTTTGNFSFFAVARKNSGYTSTNESTYCSLGLNSWYGLSLYTTAFNPGFLAYPSAWVSEGSAVGDNTTHYQTLIRSSTTQTYRRNGANTLTSTASANTPSANYQIGRHTDITFFRRAKDSIGEILVYNKALSTTERDQVETYLKNKWGL